MTEVVEIAESAVAKELTSSVGRVRPRPAGPPGRHSSSNSRSSLQSTLKPVTERDESNNEDLSASVRSFDGIDTEALKRLSAFSALELDDSERSNRTGASLQSDGGASTSSSSSSGKRSVSWNNKNLAEQFKSMGTTSSSEQHSLSSGEIFDSFSISSHGLSGASRSTLGMSGELESMGEFAEYFEPPTNIYQGQGGPIRVSPRDSSGSTLSVPSFSDLGAAIASVSSMPSLSDFSTIDGRSGHTSVMPSLGEILEEDVSANSFGSFSTGASFNTAATTDEVGIIIGGRPMSEVLKDQDRIAGRTLDVLAPTIQLKQPKKQRWSSDPAVAETADNDAPPMLASRRQSDASVDLLPGYSELGERVPASDTPPKVVQRQSSNSLSSGGLSQIPELSPAGRLSMSTRTKRTMLPETSMFAPLDLPSGFGELDEHSPVPDVAPRMVRRQDTVSNAGLAPMPVLFDDNDNDRFKLGEAPGRRKMAMPQRVQSIETVETSTENFGRLRVSGSENDSTPTMAIRSVSDDFGPLVDL
mmetsp:Transcript_35605/g.86238  ORF Transcript_35605/g.86238 Transcript_35605/m.86238 type:complete len:529 (+) Transcript_35605:76-1662(+)